MSEMIPFNSLNKHSPRCFDFARDDAINTPNDIVHVILSKTQCTWGPHKITFLWGIRKNLKLCLYYYNYYFLTQ